MSTYKSQSPYNWDRNGDNKLDSTDILTGYDLNNDGILDESELSKLAEQLTSQLEYNTKILKELNNAEQSHLSAQKELKARQENITLLTNNIELQRLECVELKRKLKLSQEVSDDMAKHSKDTRLEIATIKKELDISQKALLDANKRNNIIEQENSKNYVELIDLKKELQKTKDESAKVQLALQTDLNLIQNGFETSKNELNILRAKVSPLEIEKLSLVDHINELKYALEEMATSRDKESDARDLAEQKWKQMEINVEKKHSIGLDLTIKIQDIESKLEKSKEIIVQNLAHIQDLEGIIEELEKNKEINLKSIQQSLDDNHRIELELENKTNELEQMITQRLEEQQNWSIKNLKNKEEMQKIIDGVKNHSKEFTEDSQKRAAEAFDSRSIAEDKCLEIQAECGKLHEIIEGMQIEHSKSLVQWDNQRKTLQEKLLLCQQDNSKLEDERNNSNKQLITNKSDYETQISVLKKEMSLRGEKFINLLTIMQETVRQLRIEANTERNKVKEISGSFSLMRARIEQLTDAGKIPLNKLKPELTGAFEKLYSINKINIDQLEVMKDDIRRIQISKEEEKSRNLNLLEKNSRLESDLSNQEQLLIEKDEESKEKVLSLKNINELLVSDKKILEEKLKKMQLALDDSTIQARKLLSNNQTMQLAIGEASSQHSVSKIDIESKVIQLTTQLKRTLNEKELLARDMATIKSELSCIQINLDSSVHENEKLLFEINKLEKEKEEIAIINQKKLATVGSVNLQYVNQLKQEHSLLLVVQEQRAELQLQNDQLREELNSKLRSDQHK